MPIPRPFHWSLIAATTLFTLGCVEVEAPTPPEYTLPDVVGSGTQFCECTAADLTGRVLRINRFEIDEPEALATVLNTMWSGEIRNNIMNVLFRMDAAEKGTLTAFKSITMAAGPAWRDPPIPAQLPPEEDAPTASAVDSYCMLDGLDQEIALKPYHGYQCQYKNPQPASLVFHLGGRDDPLMCAPLLEPANATPLMDLKVRFGFNEDCTGITDGFLEGCIAVDDAERMCVCTNAGTCAWAGDPGAAHTPEDLPGYCKAACGVGWASFGGIIKSVGIVPTCLTLDGREGIRLQAFFDAVDVSDKYNPVSSDDCTAK
ncbi:MAG: hypothetical protein ABIK09_18510 [Pseudomonadota bacterium]